MKDQKNGSKEEVQEDVRIKGILDGLTGFVHGFGDLAVRLKVRKAEKARRQARP